VRDQSTALKTFEGASQHRKVERFAALDAEHLELARRHVVHSLEANLPSIDGSVVESSEPGILVREMRKKTRHLAVRRLLASIPNLLPRLKPCLLMSPMSIAQYLPANGPRFDLVVFDEASQIGTHDAIGAIARGKQVIVVGDSKQLPPTAFFNRSDDEDGAPDENDVVELESVLEEALARRIPPQMLGWHYRSRHESLIDFSNTHYYEGKLHVFPAAASAVAELGVKWHPVASGVYHGSSKGKHARTNPVEAQALVDHLVATLRATSPDDRTFGVVTFSMAQQALIEDLLDVQRGRYPEIEAHFASVEPVFVKNLENVQGDERDEILFSICYAKDGSGKLRLHFGPLSMAGGERRLNVAVTRARCALHVFSTLTHEQIDLRRTKAVGARHLKDFLEVTSRSAAVRSSGPEELRFPSQFERAVHAALTERGFQVHSEVGCGGYRVNLAVCDPDSAGTYLLGIELDGPTYGAAKTSRDRDRLRKQVLESLGWRMHRVWSSDWWFDREGELSRLLAAIEEAQRDRRDPPPPLRVKSPRPEVEALVSSPSQPFAALVVEASPVRFASAAPVVSTPPRTPVVPYAAVTLDAKSTNGEDYYAPRAGPVVREQLTRVVTAEGPIHVDIVARRILATWGLAKLTPRSRKRLDEEITSLERGGALVRRGEFLWPRGSDVAAYRVIRGPSPDGTARDLEDVPPEELANAAEWVLERNLSLDRDTLARETARLFGVFRLGKNVREAIDGALAVLERAGRCVIEGDRVRRP